VNIIFALAVKAVFIVLAFLGYTSLWLAILRGHRRHARCHRQRVAAVEITQGDRARTPI